MEELEHARASMLCGRAGAENETDTSLSGKLEHMQNK